MHVGDRDGGSGRAFVFELTGKRPHIPDRELVAGLRTYARLVGGRAFSAREWNAWEGRPCVAATIMKRFGTWRRALSLVGVTGGKGQSYPPEELIENLERVWRELGRAPGNRCIGRHGTIGAGPYRRVWGSVRRACEQFAKFKAGQISWDVLMRGSGRTYRSPLRPSLRWEVLERDGHRCLGCGRAAGEPGVKLEIDHVLPVCAGGTDEIGNLRTLCASCNRGKGGAGK